MIEGGAARYVRRSDPQPSNTMQELPWQDQILSADGKSLEAVPRDKKYRMRISLFKHLAI